MKRITLLLVLVACMCNIYSQSSFFMAMVKGLKRVECTSAERLIANSSLNVEQLLGNSISQQTSILSTRMAEQAAYAARNSHRFTDFKFNLATNLCANFRNRLEIDPNLLCISSNMLDNEGRLLVVTLIDENTLQFYKTGMRKDRIFVYDQYQPWVFVPEQGKLHFHERTKDKQAKNRKDSIMLIKKILGLPISSSKKYVVLMKVGFDQIFRPAIKSGITEPIFMDGKRKMYSTDLEIHNKIQSLFINNRYPWTSLGYTYDYSIPIGTQNWGISEFMLKRGAKVQIIGIVPVIAFLRESPKVSTLSDLY